MEKQEFLTPEQRKGLIYGSLISAVLSGGAAMRQGGNITDALGRGTMGAAQAFGGGMEEIAKMKHQEIENAKEEESIRASQEMQSLNKKKLAMEERSHESSEKVQAAQLEEIKRKTSESRSQSSALQRWFAEQRAPMNPHGVPPAGEVIDPNLVSAAEAGGPSALAQIILGTQKKEANAANVFHIGDVRRDIQEKKSETAKAQWDDEREFKDRLAAAERKSREILAAAGITSKEKVGAEHNVSEEKQAKIRADAPGKGVKKFPYMDPKTGEGFNEMAPGRVPFSQKLVDRIAKLASMAKGEGVKAGSAPVPVVATPRKKPQAIF